MAARVGPRAQGTDGSDFMHREQVARHYRASAAMKPKLKRVLWLQLVCSLVCLSVGLLLRFDFPSLLCFVGYLVGLPLGFYALGRNHVSSINFYGICCSLLGVFPMVYVLYLSLWTGLVDHYRYVRLLEAFAVVLLNTCGMYYAKNLMTAWSQRPQGRRQR